MVFTTTDRYHFEKTSIFADVQPVRTNSCMLFGTGFVIGWAEKNTEDVT